MPNDFTSAIAACLISDGAPRRTDLAKLVEKIFNGPPEPSRDQLQKLHDEIVDALPDGHDRLALVYGGATRIKGYVFEAPKLPEVRGASALLDWINETALPRLWADVLDEKLGKEKARDCIVYASGGHILGFAPASLGQHLADAIERCYAEHALTAESAAVALDFGLLDLRYGRDPLAYWIDDFLKDWADPARQKALEDYYYPPSGSHPDDPGVERQRFFNRKTFGELTTLLSLAFFRRRAERNQQAHPRDLPFYPLLPWAAQCDSSGIRPAVVSTRMSDEIEPREMSEASARKRYVGQLVKQESPDATRWFRERFDWRMEPPPESWEAGWTEYIERKPETRYAKALAEIRKLGGEPRAARDVHEIGAASGRYIGMIYADGNNVGRFIAGIKTPQEYADRSLQLRDAAKNAVFAALDEHLEPHHFDLNTWVHPFEILAIGGDDLLMIVPGDRAFDIALAIGYNFEKAMSDQDHPESRMIEDRYAGGEKNLAHPFSSYTPVVGLSAGVLIAQETAPIFFLRDLVEELLSNAKGLARRNAAQGDLGGAVDFMVMKSITMVTDRIRPFRKAALIGEHSQLIARPYTWHEFAGLLRTIRALRDARVPRSQLYRLRDVLKHSLDESVIAGSLEYLYTRSRLDRRRSDTLLTHVERNWREPARAGVTTGSGAPPWLRMEGERWETIWADLVEAYDIIAAEERNDTTN